MARQFTKRSYTHPGSIGNALGLWPLPSCSGIVSLAWGGQHFQGGTVVFSFTWSVHAQSHGWATCTLKDEQSEFSMVASYISPAPEDFLKAVARVLHGHPESCAGLDAEPTLYLVHFRRDGRQAHISVVEFPTGDTSKAGTEVWSSTQSLTALGRATVRAFDTLFHEVGDAGYEKGWQRPFPHTELEALRTAWQARR